MNVRDIRMHDEVVHEELYDCKEVFRVVGIRETEIELEGDFSGGTHNVKQKSWMSINGLHHYRPYRYSREDVDFIVMDALNHFAEYVDRDKVEHPSIYRQIVKRWYGELYPFMSPYALNKKRSLLER